MTIAQLQLGKNGVTEGFIETLKNHFKKHKIVKISVLKSYCRDRLALKDISIKILERLGPRYSYNSIGYTITIKRGRR